jgi:nitronate monooxygenase
VNSNWLTDTFNLELPIIIAPMFLVTTKEMLISAQESKIMATIPSLNFRTPEEFEAFMKDMKENHPGHFGINLIVNKSNVHLEKHLNILEKFPPSFVITSLGSPEEVIKRLKPLNVKIMCDVVDVEYAQKVEKLGADALIAVNSGAGGHAGNIAASILIPMLLEKTKLPVISAGGIGTGRGLLSTLALGACGVSMGSPFIATTEAGVTEDYKKAIVDYGAKDIVMSDKISGTPCSVILTPYVKSIGTKLNFVESYLNKNKKLKKYAKMLTYYKGMKAVERAAFGATYKTVWVAGPSIEFVKKIESVSEIIKRLKSEFEIAKNEFRKELGN